jgi:hypothetical protein
MIMNCERQCPGAARSLLPLVTQSEPPARPPDTWPASESLISAQSARSPGRDGRAGVILVLTVPATLCLHNLRYHGTQGKSARAMCQYSLLKVLFPFSLNPELYRLS